MEGIFNKNAFDQFDEGFGTECIADFANKIFLEWLEKKVAPLIHEIQKYQEGAAEGYKQLAKLTEQNRIMKAELEALKKNSLAVDNISRRVEWRLAEQLSICKEALSKIENGRPWLHCNPDSVLEMVCEVLAKVRGLEK